jgi:hypothetical protein
VIGWALRGRRITAERAVGWAVLAATAAFVLSHLYLSLVFTNSTQVLGDLGGHMHEATHLHDNLLPDFRLSGWSQHWFTGYPSLTFYFPVGALLMVLLDLVVPFNVAVKSVAALAPASLPVCAYAFGRLNGCERPAAALLGIGSVPLLLQPGLFISGGSIPASVGGEYAFGLGLSLGLVVLGLARRGLRTGRHRALTAGLLALNGLVHILPALLVGLGIVVSTLLRPTRARVRWTAAVSAVAAALVGFWALPFLLYHRFTAGHDFERLGPIWTRLTPVGMRPVLVVATVGVVALFLKDGIAVVREDERRDDLGPFLIAMAAIAAGLFAFFPSKQVYSGRFLPMWFLWLGLLAGYQVAYWARHADDVRRRAGGGRTTAHPALTQLLVPIVTLAAILPLWETRWSRGILTAGTAQTAVSAEQTVRGYELSPNGAANQTFIDAVRTVSREHGCGRAHAEWDQTSWMGDNPMLTWLIPYWTDGCIGTTQGLYIESSATSSFVNLANSRLSPTPSSWNSRAKPDFDLQAGLADLRALGVRYLVASRQESMQAADASPDLRVLVGTDPNGTTPWRIYELSGSEVVEPLRFEPVVVAGIGDSRATWETAVHAWHKESKGREVPVAVDGPEQWSRRQSLAGDRPRRETPVSSGVSRVRITRDRISFDVSRTGVPVLVKVSYFPNWRASGADGPWRVLPNQMVVVPTSRTVTLQYGRTAVEYLGWLLTLTGGVGLVLLRRQGKMPRPRSLDHSL